MIPFKEWLRWFRTLPWSVKWFVLLVLFRPIIDGFYTLKEISPFLSPLYIVGVLTPLLTLVAVIKLPPPAKSSLDARFKAWAVFVFLAILFLFFRESPTLDFFQYFIKLTMPLYLFAFLRYFVRSERELNGLLQAFLYSTMIVAAVFSYEVIVGPIRVEESRGLTRIQGFFGDVVNYGIYLMQGFLVSAYFHLRRPKGVERKSLIRVGITFLIAVGILMNIHHAASLGIFSCLVLLFLWYERHRSPTLVAFLSGLIIVGGLYFGRSFLQKEIVPLVEEEIEVFRGEARTSKLLHGRVDRWERMWERFSSEGPWVLFFGYPLGEGYPYQMISAGAHNDLLRILFFTGFFGLIIYLSILRRIAARLRYLSKPHHFLSTGALLILILFSITTTPTMYPPMLYVLYSIFAFTALPQRPSKKDDERTADPDTGKTSSTLHGPLSDDRDHSRLLS